MSERIRGSIPAPWQVLWIALALIWGSSFLFMKLGLAALEPVQISTARVVIGAATLLAIAAALRTRLPRDARTWAWMSVTAFFLCTLPFTLFALGEERVSSGLAGIGNAVTPVATVLMALLLLPSDRPTPRKLAAVALGFLGVVVIAQPWAEAGRPDLVGFSMTVVAGASYGVGWAVNRRFLGTVDLGGLSQPTTQLLAAVPQLLLALLVWSSVEGWAPFGVHATGDPLLWAVLATFALGALGTGIAYWLLYDVVRAVGPTVSSTLTYLIPVVAVGLGFFVLGETLGPAQLIGAVIVVGAGFLVQPRRRGATQA